MPFDQPVNEPPHAAQWQLPASLRGQLRDYRRRLWTIKTVEPLGMLLVAIAAAFLIVWGLDRRWETPTWARTALLLAILAAGSMIPVALYRWVWRRRDTQQLARLIGRRLPQTGDALLGVIELTRSPAEQARSPVLCQAAIDQVARQAQATDFRTALPASRHRAWLVAAAAAATVVGVAWAVFPAASANAWTRLLFPWRPATRYTFTRIEPLPSPLIVPHGEATEVTVSLQPQARWRPRLASLQIGHGQPQMAERSAGTYRFLVPPQLAPAMLRLRVGDVTQQVPVQPTLRPELVAATARVTLPDYLQRPEPAEQDARGGSLTLLSGSRLGLTLAASRPLATAQIDGHAYRARSGQVISQPLLVDGSRTIQIAWRDVLGLEQREPFALQIRAVDDLPPTLLCEGLPQKALVLDSETLQFEIRAQDDFGVRRVGMQWQPAADPSLDKASGESPAELSGESPGAPAGSSAGDQPVASGGPMAEQLTAASIFCAQRLGIEPQTIELRVWAEDYLPGRPRVYSPPYTLNVVSSNEHALWLADQLGRWYGEALEVRDRELQLHETNKQLRALPPGERSDAAARQRIGQQADDERENGRRLADVTRSGQQLLTAAVRNPEMDAEHLQRWAETLQVLSDIAENRMPSVADMLGEAADEASSAADPSAKPPASVAGQSRAPAAPTTDDDDDDGKDDSAEGEPERPTAPKVVDVESTQSQPSAAGAAGVNQPPSDAQPRLGLAGTTILGDTGQDEQPAAAPVEPAAPASLEQAVAAQQQLLKEFDAVADQLSELIANLEGSTLVKRLKAASRHQYRIAGGIAAQLQQSFAAVPGATGGDPLHALAQLASQQSEGVQAVSLLMDDMQAYVQRRRQPQVQVVLDAMRRADVLGGLRTLADAIPRQQGLALADSEYWSDALDRWADNLVPPAASGQAPGAPPQGSLPPSVVLQVLQVLRSEVDLREATRVAEQARGALASEDYLRQARRLAADQRALQQRLGQVVGDIAALPGGETAFADDLRLLKSVLPVMQDAAAVLATPDTGPPAIAAETEVIELLLKSNRVNPGAGGGGGGTAGSGGGDGPPPASPLALVGAGINQAELRRSPDTPQAVGTAGAALPEEFRTGLDEYFNRLEP